MSRKKKPRQHIQGQKIFTGWRQNELLSRISSHVSEECKTMLTELNRRFGEGKGKLTLEDYVFTLKNMVGVSVLIEAVAIGRGKQDLIATGAIDLPKTKTCHVLPVHPELPSGESCSSLTKSEIIKFLSGDIRLSKARSSDLFWEAVWPRLLARGWHSEQPRGQSHASSKSSLVFLVPGIKRFSRRKLVKLVKGTHYFDSVTDLLNKVAAEPEHLDLESDTAQVSADKEESSSDLDLLPNRKRHCYLQPQNSNCNKDSLKFTIVDTSFICGGKQVKVRDLRSLPVDTINVATPSARSSETKRGARKETPVEKEVNDTSKHNVMESHQDQRTSLPNDRQSRKTAKFIMYSRKGKSQKSSNLDLVSKQNELRACSPDEISEEAVLNTNCVDKEPSPKKTQPLILIDLDFPQVPPDSGTDGSMLNNELLSLSEIGLGKEQQQQPIITNGRRQSSRNRSMSTRALEAIEFEFGMSQKKRKAVDAAAMSGNSNPSRSTSSRRVRGKTADFSTSHSDVAGEDGDTNMKNFRNNL